MASFWRIVRSLCKTFLALVFLNNKSRSRSRPRSRLFFISVSVSAEPRLTCLGRPLLSFVIRYDKLRCEMQGSFLCKLYLWLVVMSLPVLLAFSVFTQSANRTLVGNARFVFYKGFKILYFCRLKASSRNFFPSPNGMKGKSTKWLHNKLCNHGKVPTKITSFIQPFGVFGYAFCKPFMYCLYY